MAKKGLSMQAAEAAVRKLQGTDLPEPCGSFRSGPGTPKGRP